MKPIFLFTKNILLSPFLDLFYNIIIVTCYSSYYSLSYYYKIHRVLRINVRVRIESKLELNFLLNIAEICLYFFKEYLRFRFNRAAAVAYQGMGLEQRERRVQKLCHEVLFPLLPSLYHPSQPIDHSFLTSIARNFSRGLQMCLPFKLLRPGCSPCVKICSLPLPPSESRFDWGRLGFD